MEKPFAMEIQDQVIIVKFKSDSEITPEIIMDALDSENACHEIQGSYDIWDFRGCRPSDDLNYDAMLRIIGHIQNQYNDQWSIKTAILVDEEIQFGLSRMFQTLADNRTVHISIFQDESAAKAWLSQKL